MHLWRRKVRRVWLSVSATLKLHKPSGGGIRGRGNASSKGLLKLQDDVKMCGYKDVQVMWNLLNASSSQIKQLGAKTAAAAVNSQSSKCTKQRHSSCCNWISLFCPNQTPSSSSSSFCSDI